MQNLRRLPHSTRPAGFDPELWKAGRAISRAIFGAMRAYGVQSFDIPTLGVYRPTLAGLYRAIAPKIRAEYARIGATSADRNIVRTYCTGADRAHGA